MANQLYSKYSHLNAAESSIQFNGVDGQIWIKPIRNNWLKRLFGAPEYSLGGTFYPKSIKVYLADGSVRGLEQGDYVA